VRPFGEDGPASGWLILMCQRAPETAHPRSATRPRCASSAAPPLCFRGRAARADRRSVTSINATGHAPVGRHVPQLCSDRHPRTHSWSLPGARGTTRPPLRRRMERRPEFARSKRRPRRANATVRGRTGVEGRHRGWSPSASP
jgi:hypothetical protein